MKDPMADVQETLDRMLADAYLRLAETREDYAHFFEWREWFGFRPGWPARRAARLAKRLG